MAKTKISEFSSTPANNTDIDSINIAEGCAPSGINDAIRELMSQLKDWQSGASNDPYVVGSSGSLTLNQGTANGVLYLNGSKVATSGSALTFDGTNLGVGTSSPAYKLDVNGTIRGAGDVISSATNPLFQGSSSTGSAAISNNTAGAYIRVYGSAHATKANYTDFINGSSTSTFDSSGNLGLGVTPSAWYSLSKAIEIGAGGAVQARTNDAITFELTSNAYLNTSGNWIYKTTNRASLFNLTNGAFAWLQAGSGTAGNAITFTQAMTLDSSGNLLVGATSAHNFAIPSIQAGGSNANAIISVRRDTTSSADQIIFYNPNGSVGSISTSGSSTTYGTSSDYRLKNTIAPMTGALEKVALLKPCTYKWNADGSDGQGFIAHELAEVVPHAVTGEKDAVDEDGNPKYQGIDTSFLVATLTAAIQELNAKFEAYKASHP